MGAFDPAFLALPREVLVAVMRKHQRYFPVEQGGKLLPYFIAVRNGGSQHLDSVTRGNEHVLRARFADAAYFVRRDREQPLEAFLPRLATLTFQEQLGSMLDKVDRIERLTGLLTKDLFAATPRQPRSPQRAAHLSKADLATRMVVEMTSLQGEVGRQYARADGEPEAVAEAIFEHYLPRHAGDRTASSLPGLVVGLADRLNSLMGLYAAGVQPTGARIPLPYDARPSGWCRTWWRASCGSTCAGACGWRRKGCLSRQLRRRKSECLAFIAGRQFGLLLADGHRHDAVEAVLAAQSTNPAGAAAGVAALERWVGRDDWDATLQSFARCVRITRSQPAPTASVNEAALIERAEKDLAAALRTAEARPRGPGSVNDFLESFRPMVPAVSRFFEDVLVMADDAGVRANRLALLHRVVALADGVADLSKMEGF